MKEFDPKSSPEWRGSVQTWKRLTVVTQADGLETGIRWGWAEGSVVVRAWCPAYLAPCRTHPSSGGTWVAGRAGPAAGLPGYYAASPGHKAGEGPLAGDVGELGPGASSCCQRLKALTAYFDCRPPGGQSRAQVGCRRVSPWGLGLGSPPFSLLFIT